MLEMGVLQYLEPNKFISRAQEIQNVKSESSVTVDSEGRLKLKPKADSSTCAGLDAEVWPSI